ncbi:MAG: hypothetical protein OXI46_00040 [Gemmatimonadota bacterium]|nr:hypothetical protein [Gemmatimonadota bacterium]
MEEWILVADVVVVVTAGAASFWSVRWLRDAIEVSRTRVTLMAPNSDDTVVPIFLDLLAEADQEIIIYDDGDTAAESLYQSREVVDAVKAKVTEDHIRVQCMLNRRMGETLFERELKQYPGVDIKGRASGTEEREHYKIIDRTKVYVSAHHEGQSTRNRKLIDCTHSQSRRGGDPLAIRRYIKDFAQHAVA